MSLDTDGFEETVEGGTVAITITSDHPLIKLAKALPWQDLQEIILPDLKRTERLLWWRGRPLRVRIHLGAYLLGKMFDLSDRQTEYSMRDNAAFRLFCGYGIMKKWHAPDHTKIEEFRSRLSPETQRKLANIIAVHATKLKYACPAMLDIDSTIQEANISYPSSANLLVKVAGLAKRLVKPLNQVKEKTQSAYDVSLKHTKTLLLNYFNLKRQGKFDLSLQALQSLWQVVWGQVWPIMKDIYKLQPLLSLPKHWNLRLAVEQLQYNGYRLIEQQFNKLFEKQPNSSPPIYSLHTYEVQCFDKNKLSKKKQYGRAYQLGRIGGNFAIVGECTSLHMPDAQSLPPMVAEHEYLFGKHTLNSLATDKGYYALSNQVLLEHKGVEEIGLPRPRRNFNAPPNKTPWEIQEKLHNRRAGVEAMIGHIKHMGQMDRSRMKSDHTTLAAGYASVLGFNLRQLKRYAIGKVRPKFDEHNETCLEYLEMIQNETSLLPF